MGSVTAKPFKDKTCSCALREIASVTEGNAATKGQEQGECVYRERVNANFTTACEQHTPSPAPYGQELIFKENKPLYGVALNFGRRVTQKYMPEH